MRLPCRIAGKPAMIVGYVSRKRSKVSAVVISEGRLISVPLSKIELENVPAELQAPSNIIAMEKSRA